MEGGLYRGFQPPAGGGDAGAPPQHHSLSPGYDQDNRSRRVVLERKVAQQPSKPYDENNKEAWSQTIRSYLIGERWEMKNLLTWSENWQKNEIPEHKIGNFRHP